MRHLDAATTAVPPTSTPGIGRSANAALASLPGFSLPGDISGSSRFYTEDITDPVVMHDGVVDVPTGPGIGSSPRPELLTKYRQGDAQVLTGS